MARLFPTAEASDISGYKALYVNTRRPASTGAATSATSSTSGGTMVQCTDTAGGTALKWITKPFAAACVITSAMLFNIWGREAAAADNCSFGFGLFQYTGGSEAATFWTVSNGMAELTTTGLNVRSVAVTTTGTATTFAIGDRLVLKMYVVNVGSMAVGTATFAYDGPTEGAEGDTYVAINEAITLSECQTGSGTTPVAPGLSQGFYQGVIDGLNALAGANCIDDEGAVATLIDDLALQRDNL